MPMAWQSFAPLDSTIHPCGTGANHVLKAATAQAAHQCASHVTHTTQQQQLVRHLQMIALAAPLATGADLTAQVACVGPASKAHTQVSARHNSCDAHVCCVSHVLRHSVDLAWLSIQQLRACKLRLAWIAAYKHASTAYKHASLSA